MPEGPISLRTTSAEYRECLLRPESRRYVGRVQERVLQGYDKEGQRGSRTTAAYVAQFTILENGEVGEFRVLQREGDARATYVGRSAVLAGASNVSEPPTLASRHRSLVELSRST